MNWNGPLTAKQFILLFWVPVLILAGAAFFLHLGGAKPAEPARTNTADANMADMHDHMMMAPPSPPPPSKLIDPDVLKKEQEELHRNLKGVRKNMNRSEP